MSLSSIGVLLQTCSSRGRCHTAFDEVERRITAQHGSKQGTAPNWGPVFDIMPAAAAASKRRVFDRAAEQEALAFAHHFPPVPNLGHVCKHRAG
jgi:hypothetical protein